MKTSTRVLVLILSLMLIAAALAGCGGNNATTDSKPADNAKTEAAEPAKDTSADTAKEAPAETATETAAADNGETKLCRFVQPGNLPPEYDAGIAAVNEKLKADRLNMEVEIIRIPWDAYAEKLNLMLTTGEPFELLHIMQDVKNLSAIAGMDAIISLEGLIEKYPALIGRFTDLEWKGTLYNGKRYAVPASWRNFDNTMSYITARTDVNKAVGFDSFPSNDVNGLIDLMKKSQNYILDETGQKAYNWFHQNQDTAHWLHRTYDTYPFYVENSLGLVLSRQDGTIESFYESEEFKNDANTYYEMYQAGLINPDILNLESQVKYDQAKFGAFLPSQTFSPATSVEIKRNAGIDTECNIYAMNPEKPEMIYTYCQNLNAISSTSQDPETGLRVLDWLYSNKENHDLFHYGIEGVHYTAIGEDRLEFMRAEDDRPLFTLDTWMTGYLPYMRFNADDPDSYIAYSKGGKDGRAGTTEFVVSPIAGFIFDSGPVTAELTNLQTEIIASIYPIKVGMVPYEGNIDDAISKLKSAGLDKYLEEYRRQFKEYLDKNPDVLELAKAQKYKN